MYKKKYNRNDMGVKDAFQVQWDKVVKEKYKDLHARILIPITDGKSNGITIADKTLEYKKVSGVGKARVSDERIDDVPFVNVSGGYGNASLHWITIGFILNVNDKTNIQSGKKIPDLEANTAFRVVAETENDLLLFGDAALGRQGLMNLNGKRTYNTGVTLSTATGESIINATVGAAKEFKTGVAGKFNTRTFAMHPDIFYKFQRVYSSTSDSGDAILVKLEDRNMFLRIVEIDDLVNATTGNPTSVILDDTPENFQVVEVYPATADEWPEGRSTVTAIEEKLSELIGFYPESVMEVLWN